jgi:formate C-acetyltransferase
MDKKGITALIRSITTLDLSLSDSGACLDAMLHPSAVQGEDGLEAMHALLQTFMRRGGHALHINVFSPEILRAAQKNPEKYKDLQIRVCGWNVLFNDIIKPEQDGFIRQAESLI